MSEVNAQSEMKIQTVDSTGNTDELSLAELAALLPKPEPVETPPSTPSTPPNHEPLDFRKSADTHAIDFDAFSQSFIYAGKPTTLSFTTTALHSVVVSGQVEIIGSATVTLPPGIIGPKTVTGPGLLSVRRSTYRGTDVWRASWLPDA